MKQHKWHKEINAWADGAEIEFKYASDGKWQTVFHPAWNDDDAKYRIKPQPKEQQYLYVHKRLNGGNICFSEKSNWCQKTFLYLGKIKLEVDDE